MSLLKYQDDPQITSGNGRGPLSFSRAGLDGIPFRGQPQLMREEEIAAKSELVYDAEVEIFDISIPEQKAKLKEILDRAANQWYRILAMDRKWIEREDGTASMKVYVEWVVPHKELNLSKQQVSF